MRGCWCRARHNGPVNPPGIPSTYLTPPSARAEMTAWAASRSSVIGEYFMHRLPSSWRASNDSEETIRVVVAQRGRQARHVREHLVSAADLRDHPQEVAVGKA